MSPPSSDSDNLNPALIAFGNVIWAVIVCAAINVLCGWGVDSVNHWTGNPPVTKAPTWIGTMIVSSQTGWPILALAVLCGLFGRDMSGLTPVLIGTYFLGLIDPIAALAVGSILILIQRNEDE
ncbi:hypothetical protein [Gimesia maris]|uniref:Uncharacterized protein n=1 Tax=Gimesia maris TaxID=122 RepID=A0ABX5YRQ4_9PLAN|nr:hypothetical protein [Gimesia maris]EDL59209.1 hypothetical protein PM8797T_23219 [Gimesia maris DSM 8797]QEG18248.1 hypothetical protein GmarT_41340 [Gimesia maris]